MDESTTEPKPPRREWAVTFSTLTIMAGCLIAAAVLTALVYVALAGVPEEELLAAGITVPGARVAFTVGGAAFAAFLLLGPAIGFVLTWLLREVRNQSVHVLVFAAAGAALGVVTAFVLGVPEIAFMTAGLVGASSAAGRAAISPFARV
ncbi:hypothetical protein [Cellulomonas bogoriensis]|uniref:Uncharacterized protein n=1 Tax=Cellulomonas bogoriensis 69B4 = DSM 16987 TaxID=1386082 RepID=A0A0A0C109_9CELL|nr:hypothetical protein [Cellulomonas bogoriensis]KGM13855.1 hypothetical protein N869_09095 [Cellulomonas bogoriensis 69B4 = DSM 16987]